MFLVFSFCFSHGHRIINHPNLYVYLYLDYTLKHKEHKVNNKKRKEDE